MYVKFQFLGYGHYISALKRARKLYLEDNNVQRLLLKTKPQLCFFSKKLFLVFPGKMNLQMFSHARWLTNTCVCIM